MTSRAADGAHQPQQQKDGSKPRPGQPPEEAQNFNPREVPPGEKPDKKAAKERHTNSQEPEEQPKNIDKESDKANAKSLRNDQQPNKKGDEKSDVGDAEETKRTFDKNSRLSQKGTDEPGAKQRTEQQDSASKSGKEQSSPENQSGRPQQGKEGDPKSSKQSQDGQPQQGQKGQAAKQGQNGQQSQNAQAGKDGQPSQDGEGKPGEPGKSQTPGKQSGGNKPSKSGGQSAAPGMASGKGTNNGGGGHNNGTGTGDGEGLVDTEKEANLDYARKATDLILKRLEGQLSRGKVDENVLKELGWTKDEVRRFVERMRRQAQKEQGGNTPADEARRLQFEETLRSLDLKQSPKSRSSSGLQKVGGIEMESRRSAPPAEYRELYDAFTKSLSKQSSPRDKK
jgi:hypothetical protein